MAYLPRFKQVFEDEVSLPIMVGSRQQHPGGREAERGSSKGRNQRDGTGRQGGKPVGTQGQIASTVRQQDQYQTWKIDY